MRHALLVLISLFVFRSDSIAQKITRLNGDRFELNNKEFVFNKSENIFRKIPKSFGTYVEARAANRTANTLGHISLAALGGGLALAMLNNGNNERHCDLFCLESHQVIGIIGVVLVFPISGTIGILTKIAAVEKQKKAVKLYNDSSTDVFFNQRSNSLELGLGITPNGIGLVVSF